MQVVTLNVAINSQNNSVRLRMPTYQLYTSTHADMLLLQVVTLNVAINSQNNSLITLLVANNFTELKGHVFKKFDEGTLLQVCVCVCVCV